MKSDVILVVDNISKQYRLGQVGTGTISHDLNRWWSKIRGKDDPYLKIGDTNDRTTKAESDYVWALKDINFEVQRGEVLGIIGKNGAGKSTLLKILSKVTAPTTGIIKSKGRIASLLEVGTGFHPELTGRENVYLNGAILGMSKKEIASKIDDIIEFSGCQRYIDTPTKRYSSGMTVRLAFAVAAFLEPEILIIDEVLAVGDAEFQKKALGKMQDISKGEGRTVLFVSHNMAAVKSLCTRGVVLDRGMIKYIGNIDESLLIYQNLEEKIVKSDYTGNKFIKSAKIDIVNNVFKYLDDLVVEINFITELEIKNLVIGIVIKDENDNPIIGINNNNYKQKLNHFDIKQGKVNLTIKKILLLPGFYKIDLFLGDSLNDLEIVKEALKFDVVASFEFETVNQLNLKINKIYQNDVKWDLIFN